MEGTPVSEVQPTNTNAPSPATALLQMMARHAATVAQPNLRRTPELFAAMNSEMIRFCDQSRASDRTVNRKAMASNRAR